MIFEIWKFHKNTKTERTEKETMSTLFCSIPNIGIGFSQACNPKYSDYDKTGSICASENINDTLTHYRWLISAPAGPDGVTSPMREVDFDTFFTSSKMITLDSIYFQPGSRVQCAARAVNTNGNEGLELMSPIITIGREEGKGTGQGSPGYGEL